MYSEHLAIMLLVAAAQFVETNAKPIPGSAAGDVRQEIIRAVKEPELVAALSQRAKQVSRPRQQGISGHTQLASAN